MAEIAFQYTSRFGDTWIYYCDGSMVFKGSDRPYEWKMERGAVVYRSPEATAAWAKDSGSAQEACEQWLSSLITGSQEVAL